MITRRDFLKSSSLAGASMFFPLTGGMQSAFAAPPNNPPVSPTLPKYVDDLPVPGAIVPTLNGVTGFYELSLGMATHNTYKFHRDLGAAQTFGYGGAAYLGPTIIATRGQPIKATMTNSLGPHPLASTLVTPSPLNVMGVETEDAAAPRSSVHLHGSYSPSSSDGGPLEYFPRNATQAAFQSNSYTYTWANDQQATSLWYHDHALALTRANVYAGLAGFYLMRDEFDTGAAGNPLGLPAPYGTYEIPLALQDKSFSLNGAIYYAPSPSWIPEFFGDVSVINGKAWPNMNVEQAVYRFRLLNGSEARFYNVSLSSGAVFYQIGTDGGLLDAPVPMTSLLIAPGERADVLVDFTTAVVGDTIRLLNSAVTPYPSGKRTNRAGGAPLPELMQFTVYAAAGSGAVTTLPTSLRGGTGQPPLLTRLNAHPASIARQRYLALFEVEGPAGPVAVTINICGFAESQSGVNGITSTGAGAVAKDTLEQWNIINLSGDTHPMHIHLTQFQLLNRQSLNTTKYLKDLTAAAGTRAWNTPMTQAMGLNLTVPDTLNTALLDPTPYIHGLVMAPAANEMGWKDTILCPPGMVTRILVPFGNNAIGTAGTDDIPFGKLVSAGTGVYSSLGGPFTGKYVWHCHILDHEENDMMANFDVV